jgi:hypothetical protein
MGVDDGTTTVYPDAAMTAPLGGRALHAWFATRLHQNG